jgi:hypothetical protein
MADVTDRQAIDDGLARVEAELGPIDMASTSSSSASAHCRRVVPSLPTHRRWHSGNPPNTLEGARNISGHPPSLLVHRLIDPQPKEWTYSEVSESGVPRSTIVG